MSLNSLWKWHQLHRLSGLSGLSTGLVADHRSVGGADERACHHPYGAEDTALQWRKRIRGMLQTGRDCGRITKLYGDVAADDCNR